MVERLAEFSFNDAPDGRGWTAKLARTAHWAPKASLMSTEESEKLRARAAVARRIASEVRNPADADELRKMAAELEEEAVRLDVLNDSGAEHGPSSSMAWVVRAYRRGVQLPVFVYTIDDRRVPAVMTDLSYDGCQLRSEHSFTEHAIVTIVHAQIGEVKGTVQWAHEGKLGIRFGQSQA